MVQLRHTLALVLGALITLLVGGCDSSSNDIKISNGAGSPLKKLEVEIGGKIIAIDQIAPGETATVSFDPESDSDVRIRYRKGDETQTYLCAGDVYITTGSSQHYLAKIGPEECQVTEILN